MAKTVIDSYVYSADNELLHPMKIDILEALCSALFAREEKRPAECFSEKNTYDFNSLSSMAASIYFVPNAKIPGTSTPFVGRDPRDVIPASGTSGPADKNGRCDLGGNSVTQSTRLRTCCRRNVNYA